MSYPLKYLISFAVAVFMFAVIFFIGNIFFVDVPAFSSLSWLVNLTAIELFSNLFVIQILAVIFTFAFWVTKKEIQEWALSPFHITLKILLIFSLIGFVSYSLREWIQQGASQKVMSIEEDNRNIDFFKVKILELKAQKVFIEDKILSLGGTSSDEYKKLNWQLVQVLDNLESLYRRYYSIDPNSTLLDNIQVVREELNLLKEIQQEDHHFSLKVPFTDLTQEEMSTLAQKMESQADYINALYLFRLLSLLYPNDTKYLEEESRIENILRSPLNSSREEIIRSNFLEKQSYYLAFKSGYYLKAYYGIVDYMNRNIDDSGALEIYSQILKEMEGKYIFEQDIRDSFELGGFKSFFFLNDNSNSYKEYIYLGKIVEKDNSYLVRDISIFRFDSNNVLAFYATAPYASFDEEKNRLVFNILDQDQENPYLSLTIRKGKGDLDSDSSWKLNYHLNEIPAFSLSTFKDFSSLSFEQIWDASQKSYKMGDKQRVNILFYSIYERVLAPFAFLIASFWLASFALMNPVFGERKWIKAFLLIVSAPAIGALFNFFFSDIVSIFSFLLMPNILGLSIALVLIFVLFLSSLSLFIKTLKKASIKEFLGSTH